MAQAARDDNRITTLLAVSNADGRTSVAVYADPTTHRLLTSSDQDLTPYFNKSSDDTDDITVGTNNKFATAAEKTKLGHITVTQAVDLDTLESDTATNNAKVTNATHTGEVTGSTALTVDKTAISNKTLVTAAVGDHVLVGDASDSDNLKKVTVQTIVDLASGGGTPTAVTVANEAIDTTCFPLFVTAATGDLGPKTNAALTFNSNTGAFGATSFTGSGASLTNVVNSITGTANQVIASGATGAVTLSLPQSIATSSTPQFARIGLGAAAHATYLLSLNGALVHGTSTGVGIGTTSPEGTLEVRSSDTTGVKFSTSGNASTGRAVFQMYRNLAATAYGWDFGYNLDLSSENFIIRELTNGTPATRVTWAKGSGNMTLGAHLFFTDNTYDIGASGATRPRNVYVAGTGTFGGAVTGAINAYGSGWNGSAKFATEDAVYDQVELKAPLASPALTGTPTAPLAAAGTNTTQLATTSFVQQEKMGYALQGAHAILAGVSDATTYYFGSGYDRILNSTEGNARIYVPKAGTVTLVRLFFTFGTTPTNEQSTVSLRLNSTTDTAITTTLDLSGGSPVTVVNTGLSIAVVQGDYFEVKWVTPTWATNPNNLRIAATIYVQ